MPALQQSPVTSTRTRTLPASIIYPAAVIILFALFFLRRPDALLNPQFFAEDGRIFFHDQFLFGGLEALFTPYAGYLLFIPRLVAMLASLFPVSIAPGIYNGSALLLAAFSCAIFCLPVFRSVVRSDLLRFAVCIVAAAGLDSAELVGTITQIQWYLQFAGILLLFYSARRASPPSLARDLLLAVAMLLIALSVPMLILVIPFALWIVVRPPWTKRLSSKLPAAALLAGILVQLFFYSAAGIARGQASVFSYRHLAGPTGVYLAFRAVLSAVVGRPRAMLLCAGPAIQTSIVIGIVVLLWLGWLWWKSAAPARWHILLCLYFAVSSTVLSVGARNLPRSPITFGGERYFYLSACCTVLLVAMTLERLPGWNWLRSLALLAVFAAGLRYNFSVPPYVDFHWPFFATRIEGWEELRRAEITLTALDIPINPPGWFFVLEGNVLTNGGFENSIHPTPWVGLGNIGMEVTRNFHHTGRASLIMSGTEGETRQLVWGLRSGAAYKAEVMVLIPCKPGLAASLVIEDGLDHQLGAYQVTGQVAMMGTPEAQKEACESWRKLTVQFTATSTRRALFRLQYHGAGQSILWDDVQLQALE